MCNLSSKQSPLTSKEIKICTYLTAVNFDKCKILHMGETNWNYSCTIWGMSAKEKNMGIIVVSSMKTSGQCTAVVKKANKIRIHKEWDRE